MKPLSSLTLSLLLAGPPCAADAPVGDRAQALHNLLLHDCGSCHGLTLQGGLGPSLSAERLSGRSPESLTAIILHGRPGSAMPGWDAILTADEARWIAERLLEGVER